MLNILNVNLIYSFAALKQEAQAPRERFTFQTRQSSFIVLLVDYVTAGLSLNL